MVKIADISLSDLKKFPLTLQVIIHDGFDGSSLIREGYESVDGYFSGQSRFNDSVIGWRGKKCHKEYTMKMTPLSKSLQNMSFSLSKHSPRKETLNFENQNLSHIPLY